MLTTQFTAASFKEFLYRISSTKKMTTFEARNFITHVNKVTPYGRLRLPALSGRIYYAYKIGEKEYIFLQSQIISKKYEPEFIVRESTTTALKQYVGTYFSSFTLKSNWFDKECTAFYLRESTQEEVDAYACFLKAVNISGYVTPKQCALHLNRLDFNELNKNGKYWVMELHLGKRNFISLEKTDDAEGLTDHKHARIQASGHMSFTVNDEINMRFIACPIMGRTDFVIPIDFLKRNNIKGAIYLPTTIENGKMIIMGSQRICSCCGRPIDAVTENANRIRLCENCFRVRPSVIHIMQQATGDTIIERFADAINTFSSADQEYNSVIDMLNQQIAQLEDILK
jgi:hypothetical protein